MSTKDMKESANMDERQEEVLEQENITEETNDSNVSGDEPQAGETTDGESDRIAELERLADEHQTRYLRAQADFDNFRRRTQKEKEELAQYASMKLITQLLPVLDNFDRALQAGDQSGGTDSFVKGVDMIFRQLSQVMEAEGLKQMEAVGQPFDPELHQAIMRVESDEYEEGTVVEVVQTGYMLKDKVIRHAMVKVSG